MIQMAMDILHYMTTVGIQAREASRHLARADTKAKNTALSALADAIRRNSNALLAANLDDLAAARAAGIDVIDLGCVPTPLTYFAAFELGCGSCVSVTGSHNPPGYNGLKIVLGGHTLHGEAIQDLRRRIAADDLVDGAGALRSADVRAAYLDRIVGDVRLARPLKIVLDCGNGVAGAIAPALFRRLPHIHGFGIGRGVAEYVAARCHAGAGLLFDLALSVRVELTSEVVFLHGLLETEVECSRRWIRHRAG